MNITVTSRNTYSAAELASFRLPKFPTTRKSWYELAEREKWDFVEVPGKGPGGLRREFVPSSEVMALIRKVQLCSGFDTYRVTVASGEPLTTAKALFINAYNERLTTVDPIDGIETITMDLLDEAMSIARPPANCVESGDQGARATRLAHETTKAEYSVNAIPAPPFDMRRDTLEAVLRIGEKKIRDNQVTAHMVDFGLEGAPHWLEAARDYPDLELRLRSMIATFKFLRAAGEM